MNTNGGGFEADERLFIYDRWRRIVEAVRPDAVTSVDTLASMLSVSAATIRRDLGELHDSGRLRRVRGGAVAMTADEPGPPATRKPSSLTGQALFGESVVANVEQKRAIGAHAVTMIEEGEAIIIDGGTTTIEMARRIEPMPLSIMTTSIPIMSALLGTPKIHVMITGGEVFEEQGIVLNPYREGIMSGFSATKVFIGAQAVTRKGLMQTDPLLVQNEQNLIERAEEVIVLADSSKFMRRGTLAVCGLHKISTVVTDEGLDTVSEELLASHGIEIIKVSV